MKANPRSLQERIAEIFQDHPELTQQALADVAGVTKGMVNQWLNGPAKTLSYPAAKRIRTAHGYALDWLMLGEGPKVSLDRSDERQNKVPIIHWSQAARWRHRDESVLPEEVTPTSVNVGAHTFALRVHGDSMNNPSGEPTFTDGNIIVIEPDAVDAPEKLVGSFVVVQRAGDSEATLKKLVKDGRLMLRPLNPQYPMVDLDPADLICGVVREKILRFF